jgi:hypothetical protein
MDETYPPMELVSSNPASVLHMVSWLPWPAADVLENGQYAFSVREGDGGFWTIFQCEGWPLNDNA